MSRAKVGDPGPTKKAQENWEGCWLVLLKHVWSLQQRDLEIVWLFIWSLLFFWKVGVEYVVTVLGLHRDYPWYNTATVPSTNSTGPVAKSLPARLFFFFRAIPLYQSYLPGSLGAYAVCFSKCSIACGRGAWGTTLMGWFHLQGAWGSRSWVLRFLFWVLLMPVTIGTCSSCSPLVDIVDIAQDVRTKDTPTVGHICSHLWKPIWSQHFELMPFNALMTSSSSLLCGKEMSTVMANSEVAVLPQASWCNWLRDTLPRAFQVWRREMWAV